jgi:hypothetical protein
MKATEWGDVERSLLMSPETIRYELKRFAVSSYFAEETLHSIRTERAFRDHDRNFVLQTIGLVATWREERLLKVPANWWQHFKQRFFKGWALKRWPVLFAYYDAAVILPRVPVVRPEYHTVEFAVWAESRKP